MENLVAVGVAVATVLQRRNCAIEGGGGKPLWLVYWGGRPRLARELLGMEGHPNTMRKWTVAHRAPVLSGLAVEDHVVRGGGAGRQLALVEATLSCH